MAAWHGVPGGRRALGAHCRHQNHAYAAAQGPHRDQFVERFHREARSAAAIANPHIVQVYDTGEFDGLDYLVMEYVHGVNLRYEMNQQGTFSVRETLRIIGETLDGLASAHRAAWCIATSSRRTFCSNNRGHVADHRFGLAKTVSQATLSSTRRSTWNGRISGAGND